MKFSIKMFLQSLMLLCILLLKPLYSQSMRNGAFGAPVIKFSSIAGKNAVIAGGKFGWVIDSNFVIGGSMYALANKVKTSTIDPISGQAVMLGLNYGGIEIEYIFFPGKPVHASVDMLFAGAGTTYGVTDKDVSHTSYDSQNLLIFEPQVNVEFNMTEWMHIDAGLSYRISSKPGTLQFNDTNGIGLNDLKGLSFLLTFKLGEF